MLLENIKKMDFVPGKSPGMDVVIVAVSTPEHEKYWVERLHTTRAELLNPDAYVVVVHEDWAGGAGNGLGTLYAFEQARIKAKTTYKIDLLRMLQGGAAIAVYHTAGQGTRLYPLTASEYGNKSGVKLPAMIGNESMTILEAVIKQTSIFANSRRGRLSVFWGDQLFIPSNNCDYIPSHHIDILAMVSKMPERVEWEQQNLQNYGLILIEAEGEGRLLDKCDYTTVRNLISSKKISAEGGVGISMGSFSLSYDMLNALLVEFSEELEEKKEKQDSDPFIWMPTTLDFETYLMVMQKRNYSSELIKKHYARMKVFKEKFIRDFPNLGYFGVFDIGKETYWWDYGTVDSYFRQNLKLIGLDREAEAMRRFFKVSPASTSTERVLKDDSSCLIGCDIQSGRIKNSILIGVHGHHIEVEDSILINCTVKDFHAKRALAYHIVDGHESRLEPEMVRADTYLPITHQHIKLFSLLKRDGKADWRIKLPLNSYAWEELDHLMKNADIIESKDYFKRAMMKMRESTLENKSRIKKIDS